MILHSHLLAALCVTTTLGLSMTGTATPEKNLNANEVKLSARDQPVCDFWSSSHQIPGAKSPFNVVMHYTFLVDVDVPDNAARTLGEGNKGATTALKRFERSFLRMLWVEMWYSDDLNLRGVYRAGEGEQKAKFGLQIETKTGNYHKNSLGALTTSVMIYFRDTHRIVEHQIQDALFAEVDQTGEWTGFRASNDLDVYDKDLP